ncbi:hypothetical protein [Microcoleus vaginatus]|uniref:hypothetical protein n=1 Tax=Microcoleus vaginatus TaxID=119532 RepID=UPI001F608E71
MPVPQRVNFLVEQASCLLSENGAISQVISNPLASELFISLFPFSVPSVPSAV